MQKKTEGICFAISAGICWGSMGVAAQVLMEDSGFTVGDLVAGRLQGQDRGEPPGEQTRAQNTAQGQRVNLSSMFHTVPSLKKFLSS